MNGAWHRFLLIIGGVVVFIVVVGVVDIVGATCPKKCNCKSISENILPLRVRCDDQQITNWKELNFADDIHNIVSINASKNAIAHIDGDDFRNFTELKRLDLSSNQLRVLGKETFSDSLTNVERLKLANNSISHIYEGTFEQMPKLRQLDLSSNPLVCDCGLIWLIAWSNKRDVKLQPAPKCESPINFRGMSLRKLKLGVDFRCESQQLLQQPQLLQLEPKANQVAFEGDELQLKCYAPRVAIGEPRESEDLPTRAYVFWGWSDRIRHGNSTEDIVYRDPTKIFADVHLEGGHSTDSGILKSSLRIASLTQNHTGMWDCTLRSQQANLSQSIVLHVVAKGTLYCDPVTVRTNKGVYYWPRTIRGHTARQPCTEPNNSAGDASYECAANGNGEWRNLDTSLCVYVSNTTRILEQFAKVNLTLTKAPSNGLEFARRLHKFTQQNRLGDPMDVEYIARTLLKYLDQLAEQPELGQILVDIVSQLLRLPKRLIIPATGRKLLHVVEKATLSVGADLPQFVAGNIFIELFHINTDAYQSLSCVGGGGGASSLQCSVVNDSVPMQEPNQMDAAIQIPLTMLLTNSSHNSNGNGNGNNNNNIKVLITQQRNGNLLQEEDEIGIGIIASPIIGVKLYTIDGHPLGTTNEPPTQLDDGDDDDDVASAAAAADEEEEEELHRIVVILRAHAYHNQLSAPIPAWWNETGHKWNTRVCQSHHQRRTLLIFSCSRIGYYGLLQRAEYLNDFASDAVGRRFRHPPLAIYAACAAVFLGCTINVVTYVVFGPAIRVGRRQRHALVNTWLALAALVLSFGVGIRQTADLFHCRLLGLLLHYLSLCVLLWLSVCLSSMYKRLAKPPTTTTTGATATTGATTLPSSVGSMPFSSFTNSPLELQRKPILGSYLVGWGIALLICGISSAVNMEQYADYEFCFLHTTGALHAVLVPAVILLLYCGILALCIYHQLRRQSNSSPMMMMPTMTAHSMDNNTQATEHIDLDWLDTTTQQHQQHHQHHHYHHYQNHHHHHHQNQQQHPQQHPHHHHQKAILSNSGLIVEQQSNSLMSQALSSSLIDDSERTHMSHLRGYLTTIVLYVAAWMTAGGYVIATPVEQPIYLAGFATSCGLLALFLLVFYNLSRADARAAWRRPRNDRFTHHVGGSPPSLSMGGGAPIAFNNVGRLGGGSGGGGVLKLSGTAGASVLTNSIVAYKPAGSSRSNSQRSTLPRPHANSTAAGNGNGNGSTGGGGGNGGSNNNLQSLLLGGNSMDNTTMQGQCAAELFYNANQFNVARKFFKKQKRLAKRNNFELQRLGGGGEMSSQCSSMLGPSSDHIYSRQHSAMTLLAGGTKINNTNIHYKAAAAATTTMGTMGSTSTSSSLLQANIYTNIPETLKPQHEIIRLRTPTLLEEQHNEEDEEEEVEVEKLTSTSKQEKPVNNNNANDNANDLVDDVDDDVIDEDEEEEKQLDDDEDEEEADCSSLDEQAPLYANTMPSISTSTPKQTTTTTTTTTTSKANELEASAVEAMNSLGLPPPPPIDDELLLRTAADQIDLGLGVYVSPPLQLDGRTQSKNEKQQQKTPTTTEQLELEEEEDDRRVIFSSNSSSNLTSINGEHDDDNNDEDDEDEDEDEEGNGARLLSGSPTNGSDLNYQNSEISIRSHGLYAPQADNELNLTLTDDFRCYQSSNASDADADVDVDDILADIFDDEHVASGNGGCGGGATSTTTMTTTSSSSPGGNVADATIDELYEAIKCRSPPRCKQQQQPPPPPPPNGMMMMMMTPTTTTTATMQQHSINHPSLATNETCLNETMEDDSSQSSVISYIDPRAPSNPS